MNSPVWQESWTTKEDFLAKYDTIEWQLDHVVYECLWTYPNVVFDSLNILYSYANLSPYQHENEPDCYWYHPDHLGSSSWITYSDGSAVQHLHYLPWGEDFVDQRTTSWNAMYTFSAKEKDTETGYSYFGSRYYSSDLSIWLSVDPMADKYPSISPYTYCVNNPMKLVDPNGQWSKSVHHKMIKTAVNELVRDGYVSKKDADAMIKGMQKGSNKADGFLNGNQGTSKSYIHYMRDPNVSSERAKSQAQNHVNENIANYKETGDYEYLGLAAHTMMDAVCPAHATKNSDGSYEPRVNDLGLNPSNWIEHRKGDKNPTDAQMKEAVENVKNVIMEGMEIKPNSNQQKGKGVGLIDP